MAFLTVNKPTFKKKKNKIYFWCSSIKKKAVFFLYYENSLSFQNVDFLVLLSTYLLCNEWAMLTVKS